MKRTDGRMILTQTFPLIMPEVNTIKQSIQKNNGKLFLTGRIQWADHLNGNQRYYPKHILQRQIKKYQTKIKNNMAYGECDHPDSDIVSLKNVAFIIKQIHWSGDEVIGTIMLTSNSVGRDMQALVQDGCTLSISSRGLGSLKRTDKGDQVQDDFQLVGWDLVVQPSTPGASFVNQNKSIQQKLQKLTQCKKEQKIKGIVNQILSLIKA